MTLLKQLLLCFDSFSKKESQELVEKRNWMRHNTEPRQTVRSYMNDTRASRSQWIHGPEQPGIKEIMYTYPRLMDVDG